MQSKHAIDKLNYAESEIVIKNVMDLGIKIWNVYHDSELEWNF